jgi:hypothetical protein
LRVYLGVLLNGAHLAPVRRTHASNPDTNELTVTPQGVQSNHRLWFGLRVGVVALATWVAVTEPWDANGDGRVSVHELLLLVVRFLAFPLHVLLSLTPTSVLHLLGLPDAYWPSSALAAVVISLPLWGILLIGGLVAEAWLERTSNLRHIR